MQLPIYYVSLLMIHDITVSHSHILTFEVAHYHHYIPWWRLEVWFTHTTGICQPKSAANEGGGCTGGNAGLSIFYVLGGYVQKTLAVTVPIGDIILLKIIVQYSYSPEIIN